MNKLNPKKAFSAVGNAPLKVASGVKDVGKGALDIGTSTTKGVVGAGVGIGKGVVGAGMDAGKYALSTTERMAGLGAHTDPSKVAQLQSEKVVQPEIKAVAVEDAVPVQPRVLPPFMKYVWLVGHVAIVLLSIVYTFLWFTSFGRWSKRWGNLTGYVYRSFFAIVVGVYVISFRKTFGKRSPDIFGLLRFTTVQYLAIAVLWLFTTQHYIKIVPYVIYSSLQVGKFLTDDILGNNSLKAQLDKIGTLGVEAVAYTNILVYVRLILDMFALRADSLPSVLIYSFFYRLRIEYGPTNRATWNQIVERLDKIINKPNASRKVKYYWLQIKWQLENHQDSELSPEKLTIFKHTVENEPSKDMLNEPGVGSFKSEKEASTKSGHKKTRSRSKSASRTK